MVIRTPKTRPALTVSQVVNKQRVFFVICASLLAVELLDAYAKPARDLLASLQAIEKTGARVSALFMVGDKEVASLRPDTLLNPASVTKVFTAAVALHARGPGHRFETALAIGNDRTLYVKGSGDPSLTSKHLEGLAQCVRDAGVTSVKRLVIDLGPFTPDTLPSGFEKKATDAAYRAGVAGFQVDLNALKITIRPGKPNSPVEVTVSPSSPYVKIINEAITGDGRKRFSLSTFVEDSMLVVKVAGFYGRKDQFVTYRRVPDPALAASMVLLSALAKAGVEVEGSPVTGSMPNDVKVICRHESAPLIEILKPMLKDSINPIAESLLRISGWRGDSAVGFREGTEVLKTFLTERVGLKQGAFRFTNGSGLYDANQVSARSVVRLLQYIRNTPEMAAVMEALPVAGTDGTLKRRFLKTPLAGILRAKTGTLDDVKALAGYAPLKNDRVLIFAILVNGKGKDYRKAIDDAVLSVWRSQNRR